MAYTAKDACVTIDSYLGLNSDLKEIIPNTKNRGFIIKLRNGERAVLFVYPLVHKQDNTKTYFDTRDSGPHERAVAWNYAIEQGLKYFCLGTNNQVEKFVNYIFSLECDEKSIEILSGTVDGDRSDNAKGNQIIIPNNYAPSKPFERITNQLGTFISVIHKDEIYQYLEKYDNRPYLKNNDLIKFQTFSNEEDELESHRIAKGYNTLLYGVPGCGKSHKIKKEYCNDDNHMERVVFHPDYTYSDFVGQILPRVFEGRIEYRFEPGPFSRILKKAIESEEENFYLVVEEINRGNAPAIFGDIFQLLDRDDSGCSEYGVSNENISNYVYGDIDTKIKIPSNLFVLATMNTSDQNVFTLDTAFKRRWTMRLIENRIDDCKFAGHEICGSKITWRAFAETINKKIIELGENNLGNEDNRLGAYFVREAELNEPERFGEKVLMYLWNDAFKFEHDKVFKADYHTLDELIAGFCREGFEVFSQDIDFGIETNDTDSKAELVNSMTEEQAMQTLPFSET